MSLSVQWGTTKETAVTFPIAFRQSCYIVNCNGSDWGSSGGATSAGISIQNITLQSFAVYTWERGPFRWLALGKQQWGYYEAGQTTYTLTFPISFSQRALSMCLSNSSNGKGKAVIWELGKESAGISNETWENYWIAVGVQQWGVVKSNGVLQTFPLAFATRCFAVAVTANIGSSYAVASSAWDVNKTSAIFYVDTTNAPSAGWYYAIGIQQWGRSTAATLNFSLPFQKFYCITTAQESWSSAVFENTSWIARTNNSMTWPTHRGTNINYIAVGMQQCFLVRLRLCQWPPTKSQHSRYLHRKSPLETSCWSRLRRIGNFESPCSHSYFLCVPPLSLHMSRMQLQAVLW